MQRQIFKSDHGLLGNFASRFGALLAMTGLLLLSACDGGGSTVTDNNLPEPGKDGVAPVLKTVTIQPDGGVELGQSVRVDFVASEALMTPLVTIGGVQAEVTGNITEWKAVREMTEADVVGEITFSIVYQDISGELGEAVTTTTNGSSAEYCGEECPDEDGLGPLEGHWRLDFAGVGLEPGQTDWFNISADSGERACWFDDTYEFGADGSFRNVQGDETWLEDWQGTDPAACGAPVAPHDGSNNAIFEYDEEAGTLKLTGQGAFLGLAKVVTGGELALPSDAPGSVTYDVVELIGNDLTVRIGTGGGWWEFRLKRISNLDIVGKWKLNFAGVGLEPGQTDWFNISADSGERACWFDDVYHFAGDGSFQNYQDGETWLEDWQGTDPAACGTPVAPHDGSDAAVWDYDDTGETTTVTLNGSGSFLGLAKVFTGGELAVPADAPESITYDVVELIGDTMTVRISTGGGWWEFRFERVADIADLRGNWLLDFAGVGLEPGQTDWFNISADSGERACWFDDTYQFGRDGSFRNVQGDETWLEDWQGTDPAACGAPVAPHDGSNNAIFEYDEEAGSLKLTGQGAFLGLAKVFTGGELALPGDAPGSVTYDVVELVGDSLTVRIGTGGGWWEFRLKRISNSDLVGNWKLDFAGVGLEPGQTDWFNISADSGERACWFDDVYHFSDDATFQNFQDGETWLEDWQGTDPAACGTPVAPHDGSTVAVWDYDDTGETTTVTLNGRGSFLGLAKVFTGGELAVPADAPDSITYDVVELIGDSATVRISTGGGWWEYRLLKE